MVAIPVNKRIPETSQFLFRRMVPGNILVTEVKGGDSTIRHGIRVMENFVHDYQRTIMAIPFESLITNRMNEPDSSKWVTKIYFPVM
jgi:hypothetical protein